MSRVSQGVFGENGGRELTNCAERRGSAFQIRPARKTPDFWPTRISAISGDIAGETRKSGFQDLDRNLRGGGGLLHSGGASPDVSVARCIEGFARNGVRELTNYADRRGSAYDSRPAQKSPEIGPTG